MQLPGWVPWLMLREIAWVRHGFLFPFRAAYSKPKCEQGISCRCENIDLRVRVIPLGDSLICSAIRLGQCLTTMYEGNFSWVFGCRVGTGGALPAYQLDGVLGLTWHHRGE